MKRLVSMTLIAIIAGNAFVVSAWADLCMEQHIAATSPDLVSSSSIAGSLYQDAQDQDTDTELCHDEHGNDRADHCSSGCFCLQASLQQTLMLADLSVLDTLSASDSHNGLPAYNLNSISILPPRRPPKLHS